MVSLELCECEQGVLIDLSNTQDRSQLQLQNLGLNDNHMEMLGLLVFVLFIGTVPTHISGKSNIAFTGHASFCSRHDDSLIQLSSLSGSS